MKPAYCALLAFAILLALPATWGQETEAKDQKKQQVEVKDKKGHEVATVTEAEPEVPLKIQVVIDEFDGTKKISSLPYTLNVLATDSAHRQWAHMRYGVRVPITTGTQSGQATSITYQDVGTNIDCMPILRVDGRYRLDIAVERSSVSMPGSNGKEADWKPGDSSPSPQPLIRSFHDTFAVVVRNGETVEGTSAVDPVTGHVLKIDVTLTVLK